MSRKKARQLYQYGTDRNVLDVSEEIRTLKYRPDNLKPENLWSCPRCSRLTSLLDKGGSNE